MQVVMDVGGIVGRRNASRIMFLSASCASLVDSLVVWWVLWEGMTR